MRKNYEEQVTNSSLLLSFFPPTRADGPSSTRDDFNFSLRLFIAENYLPQINFSLIKVNLLKLSSPLIHIQCGSFGWRMREL